MLLKDARALADGSGIPEMPCELIGWFSKILCHCRPLLSVGQQRLNTWSNSCLNNSSHLHIRKDSWGIFGRMLEMRGECRFGSNCKRPPASVAGKTTPATRMQGRGERQNILKKSSYSLRLLPAFIRPSSWPLHSASPPASHTWRWLAPGYFSRVARCQQPLDASYGRNNATRSNYYRLLMTALSIDN